jgi:predicted alpha/beta-hydrolase family hydrolase
MTPSPPELLRDGDGDARWTLALAHGAGAPMDSAWMARVTRHLVARGIAVVRFEFPYMAARRAGTRRPPDREPVLHATWAQVVHSLAPEVAARRRLAIGGKSMGGRIASMVADELAPGALVCLGYPFHPPGRPEQLRTAHLANLVTPTLILQGERDPFGGRDEVAGYALSPHIELCWLPDGDHDLTPRRRGAPAAADPLATAADHIVAFLGRLDAGQR